MKKSSVIVVLLLALSMGSYAQIKLGLTAGANMANMRYNYKTSSAEPETKAVILPRAGLTVDLNLPGPIGFGTGLFYSGKGAQTDLDKIYKNTDSLTYSNIKGSERTSLGYLELPLHLKYNISKLHFYFGPYLAMGVFGKNKSDYSVDITSKATAKTENFKYKYEFDAEFTDKVAEDFDYNKKTPKRDIDYGLNAGIGVKLLKFGAFAGYSLGLTNVNPDGQILIQGVKYEANQVKTYNSAIQFGVTYYF